MLCPARSWPPIHISHVSRSTLQRKDVTAGGRCMTTKYARERLRHFAKCGACPHGIDERRDGVAAVAGSIPHGLKHLLNFPAIASRLDMTQFSDRLFGNHR